MEILIFKIFYFHFSTIGNVFHLGLYNDVLGISLIYFLTLKNKFSPFQFLIHLILSLILFVNILYFRFFDDFFSLAVLHQFRQIEPLFPSIFKITRVSDIFLFADLLFIRKFQWKGKETVASPKYKNKIFFIIFTLILSQLILSQHLFSKWTLSLKNNRRMVNYFGLCSFYTYDAYKFAHHLFGNITPSAEEIWFVKNWFSSRRLIPNSVNTAPNKKNIIVVVEESLQQFVIGLKVNGVEVTPNLNKLISESYYFNNVFDQTDEAGSSDSEIAALASLHPITNGAACFVYPTNQYDSIPAILNSQNYETIYAYPYYSSYWNRNVMHKLLGFKKSFFRHNLKNGYDVGWGLSDESFLSQMSDHLKRAPQPFFSFLLTLSNHTPYKLPENIPTANLGEIEQPTIKNYLESVSYADFALGKFIDQLKTDGLYDNSVLVVYGDHDGRVFNDGLPEFLKVERDSLHHQVLDKIPLIIHLPKQSKGELNERFGGTLDIGPTILSLIGINYQDSFFMGQSILTSNKERPIVFRNGSAINEKFLFITDDGNAHKGCFESGSWQLVDLKYCSELESKAKNELEVSDLIFKGDLIKHFRNKNNPT